MHKIHRSCLAVTLAVAMVLGMTPAQGVRAAEETKKTNEKKSGTKVYDMDGCFCLIIAILNGVGASTARRLYDNGPRQQRLGCPLPRGRPPDQTAAPGRTERNQRIHVLKKKGYSLEAISDILSCDSVNSSDNP